MHVLVLAFRTIRANPGDSLVVVLTVGLGIAASTTILSFMTPYLIRELPFGEPERLVQIGQVDPVAGPVREALSRLDPNLPATFRPMTEIVAESRLQWSASSALLGIFGLAALALASLGIYGVVSYSVASRRREMGLRVALGATGKEVSRLVLAEGLKLAGTGIVLGLALAAIAAKLMASLLYGIGPFDLVTFVVVTGVFLVTAILATFLPARRAARTEPIGVLRCE